MKGNENVKNGGRIRRLRMGGYSILLVAIVIAAAVVLNMIVGALPSRFVKFELTGYGIYDISERTQEFLDSLDSDVTIYFVTTEQGKSPQLSEFIDRYAELSGHIKVVMLDPDTNPDFIDKHGVENMNSFVVESELRSRTIDYYDIYEYSDEVLSEYYSNYNYMIYGVSIEDAFARDIFDADNEITSAIDYVTTDNIPVAYTLTGHGELALSSLFTDFIDYNNIGMGELNLLTSSVPDDAGIVLINNPSTDITANELETLIGYVNGGGSIVLVTDVTSYSTEGMPNLTSLAEHCGLTAYDGVVLEPSGSDKFYEHRYNLVESLETHAITTAIYTNPANAIVYMPRSHAIAALEEYEGTMSTKPIIKTSESSYIIGSGEEERERDDDDMTGEFWIGAIAADASTGASFVWYSSSFINDEMSYYYVSDYNLNVYAATISTICDKPVTISVDSVHTYANVGLTVTETNAAVLTVIIQYVLPIGVLLAGIIVWLIRRLR